MKAIVLSSGGVDSTTALALAVKELGSKNVVSLSFLYGQKHDKEVNCSRKISEYYGTKLYLLNLENLLQFSNSSLLKASTKAIEHSSYKEQIERDGEGKVSTYVPFRNGLMLSAAAALAQSLFEKEQCGLWIGAHADDAAGNAYADCSEGFMKSMNEAIKIGTYGLVEIVAPLVNMNKAQVVKTGLELKVPYELTWSCYEGGDKACGKCATCLDRIAAFKANGVEDPIEYANR